MVIYVEKPIKKPSKVAASLLRYAKRLAKSRNSGCLECCIHELLYFSALPSIYKDGIVISTDPYRMSKALVTIYGIPLNRDALWNRKVLPIIIVDTSGLH